MHSLTKYVGGHSDLVAGGIVGAKAVVQPIRQLRSALGSQLDPNSAWMIMRSMETLSLRMHKSAQNAALVADFLRKHPKIAGVNYLGFLMPDDPRYNCPARASRQRWLDVRVLPARRRLRRSASRRAAGQKPAVSLDGTETLISHSASTTHSGVPKETRDRLGVTDSMIRISVGIENADDLIADLDQALAAI